MTTINQLDVQHTIDILAPLISYGVSYMYDHEDNGYSIPEEDKMKIIKSLEGVERSLRQAWSAKDVLTLKLMCKQLSIPLACMECLSCCDQHQEYMDELETALRRAAQVLGVPYDVLTKTP